MANSRNNPRASFSPAVRKLLAQLLVHLKLAEKSFWEAGRIIIELKEIHKKEGHKRKLSTTIIAAQPQFKRWSRNRLDEIASTVAAYPPEIRDEDESFYVHECAKKAAKRTAIGASRHYGRKIPPAFKGHLKIVKSQKGKKAKDDTREITKIGIAIEREKYEPTRLAIVAKLSSANKKLLATMNEMEHEELLPKIVPATIKLVNLDPPYADYSKTKDGKLDHTSSCVNNDCDNPTRELAIATTIRALRLSVPLLVPNGVICLWQASTILRMEIVAVIEELGLFVWPTFVWNKGKAQMGDPSSGIMYSCEFCYVLTRKGEKPLRYHETDRGQVFDCPRGNQRASNFVETHLMEKPIEVSSELLNRFTATGDIVLDAFGCSASMCIAAQSMDRQWIYCESHPKNFRLGKSKMENHMIGEKKVG